MEKLINNEKNLLINNINKNQQISIYKRSFVSSFLSRIKKIRRVNYSFLLYIFIFTLLYLLYYLSLEKCFEGQVLCSKKNSTEVKYDEVNDNSRSIIKDNNKDNKKEEIKQTQNKRFFTYLLFKISFGKRYKSFKKIEDFRMRIISEEHLIKNHLNIYNLVKVAEKKKRFVRNSYRITDLINLV